MQFDSVNAPYRDLHPDVRTFSILRDIGNVIDRNIKLEFDTPSMNSDGKLPILDLKVWTDNNRIRYTFYRKDIASRFTIHNRSALSERTKRDSLFQEGMRRLRNIDPVTSNGDRSKILADFSNTLRISGYGPKFRADILTGILARKEQMENEINQGNEPRYRNRSQIEAKKEDNKLRGKNTWFLRGSNTGVLQVQATQNGELAKVVKNNIRGLKAPDGGTTIVVEDSGKSIRAGLGRADPFLIKGCKFEKKCVINKKGDCWKSRCVYVLECNECGAQYCGQTAHTIHKRTLEHQGALRRGDIGYAMTKHFVQSHPNVDRSTPNLFSASVVQGSIKHNVERFVTEAIEIEDRVTSREHEMLNSKGEWGRVCLKRLVVGMGDLE